MPKSSLSDTPLTVPVNDFGTEHYVNGLIKFIENSEAPITIALQGEWGSGKTSLMNKLEQRLCGEDGKFIGVNINTWEYSMLASQEVTIVKILQKLVGALAEPSMKEKVGRFFDKFSRATVKAGLGMFTSETGVVDDVLDGFGTNRPSELEQLKEVLEESIEKRTTVSNKSSVLVFIDDLDRLNPPVAVEILELLKNVFTLNKCIFVLAIDYEVVVKGLKPKFGELTDKNEREFRSFFDKIIQVPFSLPVNNYRPMDFVLDSLEKVSFINGLERENPTTRDAFGKIVVSSVGKNPRSIKRLINTLSLLDCIRKCNPQKDKFSESCEAKIILFAIVAIQITYPKVYKMLTIQPRFTDWGLEIVQKLNIDIDADPGEKIEWREILNALCDQDSYLSQHRNDLFVLLNLIKETAEGVNFDDYSVPLTKVLYSSSVTGISSGSSQESVDRYELISKLHSGVLNLLDKKRPDVQLQTKRNTGNGGFRLKIGDKEYHVKFSIEQDNDSVSCIVHLPTYLPKPNHVAGKNVKELLESSAYSDAFNKFSKAVDSILKGKYYWLSLPYQDGTEQCDSFKGILLNWEEQGYLVEDMSFDLDFKFSFRNAANFEQPEVLDTIAKLVSATYDLLIESGRNDL